MIADNAEKLNGLIMANNKVLVEVGASWCSQCKSLAPRLDALMKNGKYDDWTLVTVDVDDFDDDFADKYKLRNLPTMLFFIDSVLAGRLSGAKPDSEIEEKIAEITKK